MDRTAIIEFIKQTITLQINNEFTLENVRKVYSLIENKRYLDKNDNYLEAELFYLLFTNYSFFEIPAVIENYKKNITSLKSPQLRGISIVCDGYLEEFLMKLETRLVTEMDAHINQLARAFFIDDSSASDNFYNIIKQNVYNPKVISGLMDAELEDYQQMSIFMDATEDIRDNISRNHFNRRMAIEKSTVNLLVKYFTYEEVNNLANIIIKNLATKTLQDDDVNVFYLIELFNTRIKFFLTEYEKKRREPKRDILQLKIPV